MTSTVGLRTFYVKADPEKHDEEVVYSTLPFLPIAMFATFSRLFLMLTLIAGALLIAAPQASAATFPFGKHGRLLPSVQAKIKGQNRLHRPVYRTYKAVKAN